MADQMTIDRAVVQQALEALEDAKALLNNKDRTTTMWFSDEITALRAALAQAEPVCKCDLRTRLVGDGCEVCNPELAAELAQQAEPVHPAIPLENSREAADAIEATLAEYGHPTNPVNAARAGWRAARLYTAPPQRKPLTDEEIEQAHGIKEKA